MARFLFLAVFWWLSAGGVAVAGDRPCAEPGGGPSFTVTVPAYPFGVVATSDGCWVFVSMLKDSTSPAGTAVLHRAHGTFTLERVVPYGGLGMALSHDEKVLVVAEHPHVLFLDTRRLIGGGGDPLLGAIGSDDPAFVPGSFYVSLTRDDRLLFVSDENAARITVIDFSRARASGYSPRSVIGRIPVGWRPIAVTLSKDDRYLFTTSQTAPPEAAWPARCVLERAGDANGPPVLPEGQVSVIDVERAVKYPERSVVSTVPAGCSPVRLVLSPDGATAWVSARSSNAVIAFDARLLVTDPVHARIGVLPVGKSPVGLAISKDGGRIWVANSGRYRDDQNEKQSLTVIGTGSFKVEGTIPAGAFPRELYFLGDGRTLLVTNFLSRTVQVEDTSHIRLIPP